MNLKHTLAALLLCSLASQLQAGVTDAALASTSRQCTAAGPLYWEIGSAQGVVASGTGGQGVGPNTVLPIASASKWLFAAYVAQRKGLSTQTLPFLQMTSGHTQMRQCNRLRTVQQCYERSGAATVVPAAVGRFSYGGGHMQALAMELGLGPLDAVGFAAEVSRVLGIQVDKFDPPQAAGGAHIAAAEYGRFLRRLMTGGYALSSRLATSTVCTDPATCATADYSPAREPWLYSVGHWVELDGVVSSPGAFGFYPWISADRKTYGLVAMKGGPRGAVAGQECGALIRAAYLRP